MEEDINPGNAVKKSFEREQEARNHIDWSVHKEYGQVLDHLDQITLEERQEGKYLINNGEKFSIYYSEVGLIEGSEGRNPFGKAGVEEFGHWVEIRFDMVKNVFVTAFMNGLSPQDLKALLLLGEDGMKQQRFLEECVEKKLLTKCRTTQYDKLREWIDEGLIVQQSPGENPQGRGRPSPVLKTNPGVMQHLFSEATEVEELVQYIDLVNTFKGDQLKSTWSLSLRIPKDFEVCVRHKQKEPVEGPDFR